MPHCDKIVVETTKQQEKQPILLTKQLALKSNKTLVKSY